eukprot:5032081-Pleurochrysis_carterae.AAC.4
MVRDPRTTQRSPWLTPRVGNCSHVRCNFGNCIGYVRFRKLWPLVLREVRKVVLLVLPIAFAFAKVHAGEAEAANEAS